MSDPLKKANIRRTAFENAAALLTRAAKLAPKYPDMTADELLQRALLTKSYTTGEMGMMWGVFNTAEAITAKKPGGKTSRETVEALQRRAFPEQESAESE